MWQEVYRLGKKSIQTFESQKMPDLFLGHVLLINYCEVSLSVYLIDHVDPLISLHWPGTLKTTLNDSLNLTSLYQGK